MKIAGTGSYVPERILTNAELEKLYTKSEAAEQLNVPVRFVERCVSQRRVRFIRVGRYIRIPESAITELLHAGESPRRR